jgi:hypothetical protein
MKCFSILALIVFQYSISMAQVVAVSSVTQLQNALMLASPGQIITMADGTYTRNGGFIFQPASAEQVSLLSSSLVAARPLLLQTV